MPRTESQDREHGSGAIRVKYLERTTHTLRAGDRDVTVEVIDTTPEEAAQLGLTSSAYWSAQPIPGGVRCVRLRID
jgi:hypothetical protein